LLSYYYHHHHHNNITKSFKLCTPYQISFGWSNKKDLRWAGHVARIGARRSACRVLVGKPEGRRPLGRCGRKGEDNIKMDLREMVSEGIDLI
jgi:hypothetical protein